MGGEDQKLKRRPRLPDLSRQPEVAPPPGKTTGIPLVDQGPLCNRPEMEGSESCLSDEQRPYLIIALATVLQTAATNFHAAISNLRAELLTTTAGGTSFGFIAEVLFQSLSHGLIGMFSKSLDKLKLRASDVAAEGGKLMIGAYDFTKYAGQIENLQTGILTGVALNISKGARTLTKNAMHNTSNVATDENIDASNFLKIIQNDLGTYTNNMVLSAPAALNDAEIAAVVIAYSDMDYHDVAAYEADLRELIERYKKQELASIGDGKSPGPDGKGGKQYITKRHAVWVVDGKRTRMAIIEDFNPRYESIDPRKWYDGKIVPWSQMQFVSWIDDDLGFAALEYQDARNGTMPVVDASLGKTGMKQIDEWVVTP